MRILSLSTIAIMVACILAGCASVGGRASDELGSASAHSDSESGLATETVSAAVWQEPIPMTEDSKVEQVSYESKVPVGSSDDLLTNQLVESIGQEETSELGATELGATDFEANDTIRLNLPTALSFVGPQHPIVGFAQWRVQEAYAQLQQANVLWLPTIQSGFSFHRHDGNYQASDGRIVDVNRNSFQYGLGTGATGAGTTPQPGVLASFHIADAIYQPQIAERIAWARGHRAQGSKNDQLLAVALAYFDLLDATQDQRILAESVDRTEGLAMITTDFAEAGEGLQADADQLSAEALLVRNRLFTANEQLGTSSARLAEMLSLRTGQPIRPLDITVTPIHMNPLPLDRDALIGQGLRCRPELKEAQALVAAACERYRLEKKAPFIPSVLLGFSTGGFGGGLGNKLDDIDSRYDFDAVATWRLRNLGHGEKAARRQANARIQQAKYERVRALDRVAREVSEAYVQVTHRSERIEATRQAVEVAFNAYIRHLERIKDGQGLPVEALQAVRSLEQAQRAHLRATTEFNQAQFQLHWGDWLSCGNELAVSCLCRRESEK